MRCRLAPQCRKTCQLTPRPLILVPPARVAVSRQENRLALQNMDMFAAVWLRVENPDDPEALLSDNDITLLPGEQRILTVLSEAVLLAIADINLT